MPKPSWVVTGTVPSAREGTSERSRQLPVRSVLQPMECWKLPRPHQLCSAHPHVLGVHRHGYNHLYHALQIPLPLEAHTPLWQPLFPQHSWGAAPTVGPGTHSHVHTGGSVHH